MRERKNHKLRPALRLEAEQRCKDLIGQAKYMQKDSLWVASQLYAEFDADCRHIVESVLTQTRTTLD